MHFIFMLKAIILTATSLPGFAHFPLPEFMSLHFCLEVQETSGGTVKKEEEDEEQRWERERKEKQEQRQRELEETKERERQELERLEKEMVTVNPACRCLKDLDLKLTVTTPVSNQLLEEAVQLEKEGEEMGGEADIKKGEDDEQIREEPKVENPLEKYMKMVLEAREKQNEQVSLI